MNVVQWDIITFCEEFWRANRIFPHVVEIVKAVNAPEVVVKKWLADEKTNKHLEMRGIDKRKSKIRPSDNKSLGKIRRDRLTDKQIAAVATIINPVDTRSVKEKLRSLGVSETTYAGWKKNDAFMEFLTSQGKALYKEYMPEVVNSLVSNAANGHLSSQKFLMEVTGEYRPNQENNQAQQNFMFLVTRLIEIIQMHVKDPSVIQAIAEDFQAVTSAQETTNGLMALATGSNHQMLASKVEAF